MNVVQLSPKSVYPPYAGGPHRIHGLVKGRTAEDDVWRYCTEVERDRNPLDSDRLVRIDTNYTEYVRYAPLHYAAVGCTGRLPLPDELATTTEQYRMVATVPRRAKRRLRDADVVQVEFPWQFWYADRYADDDQLLVYSSHNDEAEYYDFVKQRETPLSDWMWRRIRRADRRAVERSDLVVVVSDRDAENYRQRGYEVGDYYVAPNAAPTVPSDAELAATDPAAIDGVSDDAVVAVFVGHDVPANVEAVETLCDLDFEAIGADLDVCIVGTVCRSFDDEFVPDPVHLLGYREDLPEVLVAADVGLNPITSGGGSNIKLAEFLAYGLPTVTTPFGARTHPVTDGEDVVVADVEAFSAELSRLRDAPQRRSELSEAARELARTQFRWEGVSGDLLDEYRSRV